MSSSHSHKKKFSKGVDRISNLPNYVLCHILSFLETKQSIRTCVLSKRWKSVWTDVSCLYFHRPVTPAPVEMPNEENRAFENFVATSLLAHKCQSLDKFRLVCLEEADRFICVPAWLSIAIARDVRVLDLNLVSSDGMSGLITLPSSIFTCKSLEILKLEGDLFVRVLSLVSLPCLESLNLKGVKFECGESVEKLIGGCPVLEYLYIERNRYDNVGLFTVSSKTLRHLEIIASGFASIQENTDLKLEINAPCLKYLRLCDCVSKDFSFQSLTVLGELHLFDLDNLKPVHDCDWVFYLVEKLGEDLKILAVGDEEILDLFRRYSRKAVSSLRKLILTSLTWDWSTLTYVLEITDNLEVLELKTVCKEFVDEYYGVEEAPACLLSSLRRISICSQVQESEEKNMLRMMEFFLKHGDILRRVEISCNDRSPLLRKLLALNRKSSACEVHVLY